MAPDFIREPAVYQLLDVEHHQECPRRPGVGSGRERLVRQCGSEPFVDPATKAGIPNELLRHVRHCRSSIVRRVRKVGDQAMPARAWEFLIAAQEANRQARPVTIDGPRVLRPRREVTPTVHHFLSHVRAEGVAGVPEPLSIDADHDVVGFVEGDTARKAWPHQHGLHGVRSAARLLRRIHDASRSWVPPLDASWDTPPDTLGGVEDELVYCHGDPGPWNFVWRDDEAVALIDWDLLYPGARIDDIAYAIRWFAPMRSDDLALEWHHFPVIPDRRARVQAFLEGYGYLAHDLDVVKAVSARIRVTQRHIRKLADQGQEPHRTWVAQGMIERWEADIAWANANRAMFAAP